MAVHGVRARFAGLITTPGIAHVTRTGPFAAGVMISASHNPYRDNGIKIIDFTDPAPKSFDGYISLQLHSGGHGNMRFKDIQIRDLSHRD